MLRTVACVPVCLFACLVTLVYCGQTVGWIKMSPGTEVGFGPGHTVLDVDPDHPKRAQQSAIIGPCLLWPNGWMDQDATWYGGIVLSPGDIVLDGDPDPNPTEMGIVRLCGFRHNFASVLDMGGSRASSIAIFPISCTRYRVFRLLSSRLTLDDALRPYFRLCRNRK